MCTKERLLDLIENFVAFQDLPGGFVKLLARNHQYLGVNNALARMEELRHAPPEERGKLGVFWHTQGSGKTLSMFFFSQKVLRKMPGNWSFVIVTDRDDLDEQAYKEFSARGRHHREAHAGNGITHLRQLLREDRRYVFTLIQKFRTEKGETHPVVSDRDDVIVITDEAHRTQYDVLALNMRNALPNAGFLGFTGTPLIAGEEKTRRSLATTSRSTTSPLDRRPRHRAAVLREPHSHSFRSPTPNSTTTSWPSSRRLTSMKSRSASCASHSASSTS